MAFSSLTTVDSNFFNFSVTESIFSLFGSTPSGVSSSDGFTNVSSPPPSDIDFTLNTSSVLPSAPRRRRLSFASDTKMHDGLKPEHKAIDELVYAIVSGELSPTSMPKPNSEEVMSLSEQVFSKYAQSNPTLCVQLYSLTDDLISRLMYAKQIDDQNAAQGVSRLTPVPVLCAGGGSTSRLRSIHLSAMIFMQSLIKVACTVHPV
jgi:hypothetical protein